MSDLRWSCAYIGGTGPGTPSLSLGGVACALIRRTEVRLVMLSNDTPARWIERAEVQALRVCDEGFEALVHVVGSSTPRWLTLVGGNNK